MKSSIVTSNAFTVVYTERHKHIQAETVHAGLTGLVSPWRVAASSSSSGASASSSLLRRSMTASAGSPFDLALADSASGGVASAEQFLSELKMRLY